MFILITTAPIRNLSFLLVSLLVPSRDLRDIAMPLAAAPVLRHHWGIRADKYNDLSSTVELLYGLHSLPKITGFKPFTLPMERR